MAVQSDVVLENLLAKLFIARTDVKAIQAPDGAYYPHVTHHGGPYIPWSRQSIRDHVEGRAVYGHYLLNTSNECKFFAFDIDLDKTGLLPTMRMEDAVEPDGIDWIESFEPSEPRAAWLDRSHPARSYMKYAMKKLAMILYREIEALGLPAAVAYTGSKGLHVYGFTGLAQASLVRSGMNIVIKKAGLEAVRGNVFYKAKNTSDLDLLTIETFPKQDALSGSDGLGNLMRLPLGRNLKSPDETFFLNIDNTLMTHLTPASPVEVLNEVEKKL